MRLSLTAQSMRGGAFVLKKVPCITLIFSVFLFLLLFANLGVVSAQNSVDSQDCEAQSVPTALEILTPSSLTLAPLRMTSEVDLSSELRMTDGGIPNPYSLIPSPFSTGLNSGQNDLTVESDAQLSAKRVGQRAMYRLYNKWTGEHFYTCSEEERDEIAKVGWTKEDIGWVSPKESSTPVYRLYNKYIPGGDHHYTPSADERDSLVKVGWIYEGIGWYSADEGSLFRAPVYRQYNPYADTGTHNYTLSTSEKNNLVKAGWHDEGVGYYGLDQSQMSVIDFNKDIRVTTTSKVYNGKAQTQTITSTNLKENEDYVVEYSNNKNAGTATITITGTNGFYGEKVYTFQITQKTISEVKWGDLEFGYDGKAHVPTAAAVGLCSGDSATITVTASGNHADTGTYTATATAISNKNYKLASGIKTDFKIGTKIDFDNKNKPTVDTADEVYTGSAITKEISIAGLTKDKDYSVTYKDNVNAGTATLTIKGIGECFGEKSYTFKINQRDISDATVTLGTSLTYNGEAQKQTISKVAIDLGGTELVVPSSSYVISDNEKTDADSYTLKITGNGNFKGSVSKDFVVAKLDITNATVTLGTALTYDTTEQTQTVTEVVVGNLTLTSSDYTLSDNKQKEAGKYTLKVTATSKNFTGTKRQEFVIAKATPKYDLPTGLQGKIGKKLSSVDLSSFGKNNTPGTFTWDAPDTEFTTEGDQQFSATFTPNDVNNYNVVNDIMLTVSITEGVKATFDANAPSGTTATVDGTNATTTVVASEDDGSLVSSDVAELSDTPTCSDGAYTFAGWAKTPGAANTENTDSNPGVIARSSTAMAGKTVTNGETYYAIWKDNNTALNTGFWMSDAEATATKTAESGYTSDGHYMSSKQILADVAVMNAGSSDSQYARVIEKWNEYYDKDIRLYSTWSGSDATAGTLNALVDFRILQVGEHDSDGSVVTFVATHSLPTAKIMNSSYTNAGGWGSSDMLENMTSYVQASLPSSLGDAALSVNKVATSGSYGYWVEGTTTPSKFWLPSYSEIFGETSRYITTEDFYKAEGTQYAWCKTNVTNATSSNTSLQNIDKTRAGGTPAGATGADRGSCWWLRSPSVFGSLDFCRVNSIGYGYNLGAEYSKGVVPAFCF